jgi:hypothetical protein
MPELGIGLSKTAQAMTGAFPVDVTVDDNPHPIRTSLTTSAVVKRHVHRSDRWSRLS